MFFLRLVCVGLTLLAAIPYASADGQTSSDDNFSQIQQLKSEMVEAQKHIADAQIHIVHGRKIIRILGPVEGWGSVAGGISGLVCGGGLIFSAGTVSLIACPLSLGSSIVSLVVAGRVDKSNNSIDLNEDEMTRFTYELEYDLNQLNKIDSNRTETKNFAIQLEADLNALNNLKMQSNKSQ